MKKYLLCPATVTSKTDGDEHYISASDMARLYGVPMSECLVRPSPGPERTLGWNEKHGLVELWPRYDGNYKLPPNT